MKNLFSFWLTFDVNIGFLVCSYDDGVITTNEGVASERGNADFGGGRVNFSISHRGTRGKVNRLSTIKHAMGKQKIKMIGGVGEGLDKMFHKKVIFNWLKALLNITNIIGNILTF